MMGDEQRSDLVRLSLERITLAAVGKRDCRRPGWRLKQTSGGYSFNSDEERWWLVPGTSQGGGEER